MRKNHLKLPPSITRQPLHNPKIIHTTTNQKSKTHSPQHYHWDPKDTHRSNPPQKLKPTQFGQKSFSHHHQFTPRESISYWRLFFFFFLGFGNKIFWYQIIPIYRFRITTIYIYLFIYESMNLLIFMFMFINIKFKIHIFYESKYYPKYIN